MKTWQMREAVASAYDGLRWKQKVKMMTDAQVIAVYFSFKKRNMFGRKSPTPPQRGVLPGQISIFDILKQGENHEQLS